MSAFGLAVAVGSCSPSAELSRKRRYRVQSQVELVHLSVVVEFRSKVELLCFAHLIKLADIARSNRRRTNVIPGGYGLIIGPGPRPIGFTMYEFPPSPVPPL